MTFSALVDIPYDTGTVIFIVLFVLATTALSSVAGFGFGTVAVPILLLILPPQSTVAIVKVLGSGTGWIVLLSIWRHVRWRTIAQILPAAIVGLVIGGWVLKVSEPAVIQLFVGVLVLISAVSLIARPLLIERDSIWSTAVVGFLTGVMGNATGLLAPAVVVYFTGRQFPRDVFRATTLALFLVVEVFGLPTLALQGALAWDDVRFALLLVPVAIAGRLAGLWLVRYVSQRRFRRLTIALLFVMAATSIVTALRDLAG
jgi:uncharacterized membrane protein YfcA